MKRLLVPVILLLAAWPIPAQEETPDPASLPLETTSAVQTRFFTPQTIVRLGEVFSITFEVELQAGVSLLSWPQWELLGALEVIDEGSIEIQVTDRGEIHRQELRAVVWETGSYLMPEIRIAYQIAGRSYAAAIGSLSLVVPPALADPKSAPLRASAPPQDLPYIPIWGLAAATGVVGLMTVVVARRIRQSDRRGAPASASAINTIAQLEDLKNANIDASKTVLLAVDYLRRYISIQLGTNVLELTSSELLAELNRPHLTRVLRQQIAHLLQQADLVKFAGLSPSLSGAEYIDAVIRWIRRWEQETELMSA
jgi:hypothetical protein